MKSIRHRRGTLSEWESYNPIIPDGEIALVKYDTGYGIAIGDGKTPFNELSTSSSRIKKDMTSLIVEEELHSGDDLRLGIVEELHLDIKTPIPDDFFATVTFISENEATMLSLSDNDDIYFTGTDTDDGFFSPYEYMRYNIFLFYDGSLQGVVRGYEYE